MTDTLKDYFVINYTYDVRDRLMQKAVDWEQSGPNYLLNYRYDPQGNVTNIASGYGNGAQLGYGYDALNRLTNVWSQGQLAAAYAYDWAGNLQGVRYVLRTFLTS